MAGKVIRDYTPGVNDFLHFAEVMNKNAAIDMRNPSSVGMPTPSPRGEGLAGGASTSPTRAVTAQGAAMPAVQQTPEALSGPAALERIQQNFKAVGGKI